MEMRFQKSLKNLFAGWLGQAVYIFINLILRKVFLNTLGMEMMGIQGLFANILNILSFAELGFASAFSYSLYKPLVEKDVERIQSIMHLFKVIYCVVGIFIFSAGTCLIPFLNVLIPEVQKYKYAAFYYELFVLNTSVSYFFSYKATLVEANQERYKKILNHYFWVCFLGLVQIFSLIWFENYIVFLVIQLLFILVENISISVIADKIFPYLRKTNGSSCKAVWADIKKNVAGTFLNKIGSVMVTATDNILISKFAGLAVTGIFSGYVYIVNGIWQIAIQVFEAIQAGIGDLNAKEGSKRIEEIYNEVIFYGFIIYSFNVTVLVSCLTDFIFVWMGADAVLDNFSVCLYLCTFYISGMRRANNTFINAMGLYWNGRYRTFIEGMFNLGFSIILGWKIGIKGVVLGTVISGIMIGWVVEPYIVYKYGIKTSPIFAWKIYIKYALYAFGIASLSRLTTNQILIENGIVRLVVKLMISTFLYICITCTLWKKTKEFEGLLKRTKILFK